MDITAALEIAGPGSHAVTRPRGVPHVYVGTLTPTGRVPRAARPVCRAHTGTLAVLPERRSSLVDEEPTQSVCARCSACLPHRVRRQAESCTSRDDYRSTFAHLTAYALHVLVTTAGDVAELNTAAHLSLVLHGYLGCEEPVQTPAGGQLDPINHVVGRRRALLDPDPWSRDVAARTADADAAGIEQRRREAREIRADRNDRIHRLGFVNATTR